MRTPLHYRYRARFSGFLPRASLHDAFALFILLGLLGTYEAQSMQSMHLF